MKLVTHQPYIAIEGVIGVGKTTLARLLCPPFDASLLLEAFDENPFLSNFYSDRARYAFQTQIFFLLSRYRQQQSIFTLRQNGAVLSDYLLAKDPLFARLNLQGDEHIMYERLYAALAETVPAPDLVIYLRAELDTLMARIAMRDRPYERQMDRGYMEALRQAYENLFATYEKTPLLVIETDALDFVKDPADLEKVANQVHAALSGIRQPTLPDLALQTPPQFNWKLPSSAPEEPRAEANWQVLGDYLALTKTIGDLGGVLGEYPPIGPEGPAEAMQHALTVAAQALGALAQRVGVQVDELDYHTP